MGKKAVSTKELTPKIVKLTSTQKIDFEGSIQSEGGQMCDKSYLQTNGNATVSLHTDTDAFLNAIKQVIAKTPHEYTRIHDSSISGEGGFLIGRLVAHIKGSETNLRKKYRPLVYRENMMGNKVQYTLVATSEIHKITIDSG